MHMADALISPQVGAALWIATAATGAYCIKKVQHDECETPTALAGILGAFVFAAQMINFSIPGTGSSGHIGGGLLLSILLGPHLGFLAMSAILLIQALFFADGGLLSYGCNVFNLAFYTCFIAYPLIYKPLAKKEKRSKAAIVLASVAGLQLGAFSVVLETLLSGKTELPFGTFILLMQPIHLAIGLVEGLLTAVIVGYVQKTAPQLIRHTERIPENDKAATVRQKIMALFILAALITGGLISWFASENPDGLEWSIAKVTGSTELSSASSTHALFSAIQEKIAILPDYSFKASETSSGQSASRFGTTFSGITGALLTFVLLLLTNLGIKTFSWRKKPVPGSTQRDNLD